MKFLCICERGNCRSVTLAYLLKDGHNENALACGSSSNGPETLAYLFEWADRILVTDSRLIEKVTPGHLHKMRVLDVGPDRWGQPLHPELQALFAEKLHRGEHL